MSIIEQRFIEKFPENSNYKEFPIERKPILENNLSFLEKYPLKETLYNKLIIKDSYSNNKDFRFLESNEDISNDRLDSLITEYVQIPRTTPIFPRISTIIDTAVHPRTEPAFQSAPKQSFESNGFCAIHSAGLLGYSDLTVNGKPVKSEIGRYARIDFTPGHRTRFYRSKITDSIANGLSGLVKYLSALDTGEVEEAPVLVGYTNLNMALICQRIGFSITDNCKTEEGEIDRSKGSYTVVGKIEDIRVKVAEFQRKGTMERIQERQEKLQRKEGRVLFPSLA